MSYIDSLQQIKLALESALAEDYDNGDISSEELFRSYAYIKTALGSGGGGGGGGGDASADNQLEEITRLQSIIDSIGEVSSSPTANTLLARIKEVVDGQASLDTLLTSINNKTPNVTLGQKTKASSLPVTLASDTGTLPVSAAQSGSWNIGQSGTWTVNQGGTWNVGQSGSPWSFTLTDGSNTASIRNLAANDALNVAIVDADGNQITTFGGGGGGSGTANTEYQDGATDATPNGLLAMWYDAANTLRATSASKPFPVDIKNTSLVVTDTAAENSLSNIETDIDSINTKIPSNIATDRNTAGGPFAVRLSDGSSFISTLPVSGTVSVTGVATETTLSALNTKIPSSPATDRTTAASPFSVRLSDGSSFLSSLAVTQSGTWSVNLGTLNGAATNTTLTEVRDRLSNVTSDYDTGAGTQNIPLWGLALPASGGAVAVGTTNPLPISDAGGNISIDDGGNSITTDTDIAKFGGASVSLGQTNMAGSIPVVLPTNQSSIPVSQSGSWSLSAAQSGTWTVQPGNTANTTPWLFSIHDGTTKATVRELGTNDALNVAIVDGSGNQITSFGGGSGGGTEYTEGDVDTTITGTAILWEDASDTLRSVSSSKPLPVDIKNTTVQVQDVSTNSALATIDTKLGNIQTSSQLLDDVVATTGSAALTKLNQVGGSDGTNARVFSTNTSGHLNIADGGNSITVDNGGTFAVQASQSGTWNINNISGTVSLPTGAATETTLSALNTKIPSNLTVTSTRLLVDGSGVTQPVSGTVTVSQGTASSLNATARMQDGAGNALTSATRGSERALSVQLVDGSGTQITSFGGGTQYANNAAQATPTGTVSLGHDGSNVRALNTNGSGHLNIADGGNSITVDAPVATPVFVRLSDGSSAISNLATNIVQIGGSTQSSTNPLFVRPTISVVKISSNQLVRPNDTIAYALGDSISNSTTSPVVRTFSNVVTVNGGSGEIVRAVCKSNQNPSGVIRLFLRASSSAPSAINDNVTYSNVADLQTDYIGWIDFSGFSGGIAEGLLSSASTLPFACHASNNALYGQVMCQVAFTPVANQTFDFELWILDRN